MWIWSFAFHKKKYNGIIHLQKIPAKQAAKL